MQVERSKLLHQTLNEVPQAHLPKGEITLHIIVKVNEERIKQKKQMSFTQIPSDNTKEIQNLVK